MEGSRIELRIDLSTLGFLTRCMPAKAADVSFSDRELDTQRDKVRAHPRMLASEDAFCFAHCLKQLRCKRESKQWNGLEVR